MGTDFKSRLAFWKSHVKKDESEHQDHCDKCSMLVYGTDCIRTAGKVWHRKCFRCHTCSTTLTICSSFSDKGQFYCLNCYPVYSLEGQKHLFRKCQADQRDPRSRQHAERGNGSVKTEKSVESSSNYSTATETARENHYTSCEDLHSASESDSSFCATGPFRSITIRRSHSVANVACKQPKHIRFKDEPPTCQIVHHRHSDRNNGHHNVRKHSIERGFPKIEERFHRGLKIIEPVFTKHQNHRVVEDTLAELDKLKIEDIKPKVLRRPSVQPPAKPIRRVSVFAPGIHLEKHHGMHLKVEEHARHSRYPSDHIRGMIIGRSQFPKNEILPED